VKAGTLKAEIWEDMPAWQDGHNLQLHLASLSGQLEQESPGDMKDDDEHRQAETAGDAPARRLGMQFSLLSLLALTTVSAGVLAFLRPLDLPPGIKLGCAAYAILMAAYVLLRGAALCRNSFRLRRQVAERRRELATWLDEKRR
jgi:hypothetical protein